MGLRDSRVEASRATFAASQARVNGQRAKVADAEKALADARVETERALAGEAKARVDAAPRAGELLRKAQSLLGVIEGEHAAVEAAHQSVLDRGPTDATVAHHEEAVGVTGEAVAECVAGLRAVFDAHSRAANDAEKDVQSVGLGGLARPRRQAHEGLEMLERYSAAITSAGWRR